MRPQVARRDTILLAVEASKRPYSRKTHIGNTKAVLIQNIDIRKALGEVYETGEINQEILHKSVVRLDEMREEMSQYYKKKGKVKS